MILVNTVKESFECWAYMNVMLLKHIPRLKRFCVLADQHKALYKMSILLWPPNIGPAIIFCSCDFFFLLVSFFLAYSQRSDIGCLPYFDTWCRLSANLESMSEIYAAHTRLAENTQKLRKKSPSAHHRTTSAGYIFATKACIDNRKKTC